MALYGPLNMFCMSYCLRTMCSQHEYKDKQKKNIKVFLENWLVRFIQQEMWISHAKLLVKHSRSMYRYLCFLFKMIQVIIYIMTLGCKPNITWSWARHFSTNSSNPSYKMTVQKPLSKHVAMRISSRLKVTWNGFAFATCEWDNLESTLKVEGISSKLTTTIAHEFNDSTFFA